MEASQGYRVRGVGFGLCRISHRFLMMANAAAWHPPKQGQVRMPGFFPLAQRKKETKKEPTITTPSDIPCASRLQNVCTHTQHRNSAPNRVGNRAGGVRTQEPQTVLSGDKQEQKCQEEKARIPTKHESGNSTTRKKWMQPRKVRKRSRYRLSQRQDKESREAVGGAVSSSAVSSSACS